jgi:arabinofuranosyltransferase
MRGTADSRTVTLSKSFQPSPADKRPESSSVLRPLDWTAIAIVVTLNAVYYCATARRVTAPGFPLDDSWIHLQFARNLVAGHGFSFNPGVASSGSTAPLWTFLLVVPTLLHVNIMAAAKTLGTALMIVTAIASAQVVALLTESRLGAVVAGLTIALGSRFAWASVSGMEVPLYCALTALALLAYVRALRAPAATGAGWAVLTMLIGTARPESFVFFPVLLAHWVWRRGDRTLTGIERAAAAPLVAAAVVSVVYVAFNYYTGGRPLPSTFYAKSADHGLFPAFARQDWDEVWFSLVEAPVRYVGILLSWSYEQSPLLTLAVLVGALSYIGALPNGASARDGAVIVVIYLIAPAVRGAVVPEPIMLLHDGRYVVHLLILYFMMAAGGLAWLWSHTGAKRWVIGLFAAVAVAELLAQDTRYVEKYAAQVKNINDLQLVTADWIRQHTAPDARIATNDIGAIAYVTERPIIDTQGLVTPAMIPYRRSRRTADYLMQSKPDLVVIFPEWYPELKFRRDILDEIAHVTARPVVIAYGPTLVIYRTPWTRPDRVYGVQPLAPPARLP